MKYYKRYLQFIQTWLLTSIVFIALEIGVNVSLITNTSLHLCIDFLYSFFVPIDLSFIFWWFTNPGLGSVLYSLPITVGLIIIIIYGDKIAFEKLQIRNPFLKILYNFFLLYLLTIFQHEVVYIILPQILQQLNLTYLNL